jgi:phosphonate transport system substrate-binding protein
MNTYKRLGLVVLFLLAACDGGSHQADGPRYSNMPAGDATPLYRLAVHLGYSPEKLSRTYLPLIDYLNRSVPGARFELEASRDFPAYQAKFRAREPELLLPNPWETLEAMKVGYNVIAMAGDAEDFKGLFVVRKESGIRSAADLKGKVVSYPSPTALAACVMPQYFLHSRGIDVNRDIDNHYVGSQESSIMHAYLKQAAAAATWPTSWRLFQKDHPKEAAELKVVWETPPLMNNSLMIRDDVPPVVRERVRQSLFDLEHGQEGRKILAGMETARFHAANDASYEPVRKFIERFEREVRPVEK